MLLIILVCILCLSLGLLCLLHQNQILERSQTNKSKDSQSLTEQKREAHRHIKEILQDMKREKEESKKKPMLTISAEEFLEEEGSFKQLVEAVCRLGEHFLVFCISRGVLS